MRALVGLLRWPLWALGMFVGLLVRAWQLVLYLLLLVFLLVVVGGAWLLVETVVLPA